MRGFALPLPDIERQQLAALLAHGTVWRSAPNYPTSTEYRWNVTLVPDRSDHPVAGKFPTLDEAQSIHQYEGVSVRMGLALPETESESCPRD